MANSALLVMDVQRAIVDRIPDAGYLPRLRGAIDAARVAGIDSLVLTGIATSGVVLSTLRQAADLDFSLTVLADGCLDADSEVHRVLTEKVFPRQADVATVDGWVSAIRE
jgi:nicotinamidase-related amidase